MQLTKTLHKISKLKWMFLVAQIILIAYCFIYLPDNLVSLIGILIYISGIQLGLESLSDVEKMSSKEIERHKNPSYVRIQGMCILAGIVILVIISTFFMSLKFVFGTREIFHNLFDLGLDCWALILGFLCLLKYLIDKNTYAKSLHNKGSIE